MEAKALIRARKDALKERASSKVWALQKGEAKERSLAAIAAVGLLKGLATIAAADHLLLDELSSRKKSPSRALARTTRLSTTAVAEYCPKASRPHRPGGSINLIL